MTQLKVVTLLFLNMIVWGSLVALVFFSPSPRLAELSSAPKKVARIEAKVIEAKALAPTAAPKLAEFKPSPVATAKPEKPLPVSMEIPSIALEAPIEQVKNDCSPGGLWGYDPKKSVWCIPNKRAIGFMPEGWAHRDGFNGHSISEGFTKTQPGKFGDVFVLLPKVKEGDEMVITFADGTEKKYVAKKATIGLPDEVFNEVPEESDAVYLITCACYGGKDPKVAPPNCWVCTGTQNGKRCSGGEWQIKFRLVIWFVPVPE